MMESTSESFNRINLNNVLQKSYNDKASRVKETITVKLARFMMRKSDKTLDKTNVSLFDPRKVVSIKSENNSDLGDI